VQLLINQVSLEVVKFLVEKGADIHSKTQDGRTALMLASGKGHLEVVKYLGDTYDGGWHYQYDQGDPDRTITAIESEVLRGK
jgi:ankyrin repeat protein